MKLSKTPESLLLAELSTVPENDFSGVLKLAIIYCHLEEAEERGMERAAKIAEACGLTFDGDSQLVADDIRAALKKQSGVVLDETE